MCATLELQAKNLVAGWFRIIYAIISSLFLGAGITIGTVLYGLIDKNATTDAICQNPLDWRYNFLWVGAFALSLLLVNQARWRQAPVMVAITLAGYVVNHFLSLRFVAQPVIAKCMCGFTVAVLGKIYSRVGHGLAFAVMLPAIFVQVPDGLALRGSPFADIEGANEPPLPLGIMLMVNFGVSMFQFAIGAAIGVLFLDICSALIAYVRGVVLVVYLCLASKH